MKNDNDIFPINLDIVFYKGLEGIDEICEKLSKGIITEVEEVLEKHNIKIKNEDGEFRNTEEVLMEIYSKLNK